MSCRLRSMLRWVSLSVLVAWYLLGLVLQGIALSQRW